MPRHPAEDVPLTEEQRDLASMDKSVGIALFCATPWVRSYPDLGDDFVSAARLGLVKAARGWDPSRGTFNTYVGVRVKSECREVLRAAREKMRTPPGPRLDAIDSVPARPEPDPFDGELIGPLLASLPPRSAAVVRSVVIDGATLEDVGAEHDLSKQRVSQILRDSLAALRRHRLVRPLDPRA